MRLNGQQWRHENIALVYLSQSADKNDATINIIISIYYTISTSMT